MGPLPDSQSAFENSPQRLVQEKIDELVRDVFADVDHYGGDTHVWEEFLRHYVADVPWHNFNVAVDVLCRGAVEGLKTIEINTLAAGLGAGEFADREEGSTEAESVFRHVRERVRKEIHKEADAYMRRLLEGFSE